MENLLIFKERNLNNLKFLSLINIQLSDISSLLTCSLKNLTNLGFQDNNLGNDCIEIFKKIELPKLEKLYLFNNKISSP